MGEAIPYARVEKGPQSDGPWNAEPSSFKSGSTSFPLLIWGRKYLQAERGS